MATIKYGSNLVLIGPSPSDSDHIGRMNYLRLVQSFGLSINSNQKSVVGIGSKGRIDNKDFPQILNGSIDYLLSDGVNEKLFGLTVESPFDQQEEERKSISNGLQARGSDQNDLKRISTNNNLFLLARNDFDDAINVQNANMDDFSVMAIGNCYVNSYRVSMGLDKSPSASVSFSAESFYLTDYSIHTGTETGISNAMPVPAIKQLDGTNSDYSYIIDDSIYDIYNYSGEYQPLTNSPHVINSVASNTMDIEISGNSIGVLSGSSNDDSACFQSFDISVDFPRYEHRSIKSKYIHDRPPLFPCGGSVGVSIIVDEFSTGDSRSFSGDFFDISLTLKGENASGEYDKDLLNYNIKSAKLESQSFTQGIGGSLVWNANFSFLEGESTDLFNQEDHSGSEGLFMSGLPDLEESKIIYEKGVGATVAESGWLSDAFPAFIEID